MTIDYIEWIVPLGHYPIHSTRDQRDEPVQTSLPQHHSSIPTAAWLIALAAVLLAGFTLAATLVLRGAQDSLRLAIDRLGADIVVVPLGAEAKAESALLMGAPTRIWMPAEDLQKVQQIHRGGGSLAAAFPLQPGKCRRVVRSPTCSWSPMTPPPISPCAPGWTRTWAAALSLKLGEVVGGQFIFVPDGAENIELYGYFLTLKGKMARHRHRARPIHLYDLRNRQRRVAHLHHPRG